MASCYVRSAAAGTGDGSSWTNAYTTLAAAVASKAAGDTFYVSEDHAETQSTNMTVTAPGTTASPNLFVCVNHAGSVPPVPADVRTTATCSTTGASSITFNGCAYFYGILFSAGSGGNAESIIFGVNNGTQLFFDTCGIKINSSGSSHIYFGTSAGSPANLSKLQFKNTVFTLGAGTDMRIRGAFVEWFGGCSLAGSAVTTLFTGGADNALSILNIRDSDLSLLGSGKTLFGAFGWATRVLLEKCKLGASVTVSAQQTVSGCVVDIFNCDSGATQYRNERYTYAGNITTETVVIPSGGATDGTTPFSHKIVTTANDNAQFPFESFPMGEFYAGTTGISVSQTFELMTDNVVLQNTDAWVELEYLGSAATPLGSVASSGPANPLSTGSNLTTSSATWTTTGITTPKPQKITVSFTPQMVGMYRAVLKVAKASTTLWLSPPATKAA